VRKLLGSGVLGLLAHGCTPPVEYVSTYGGAVQLGTHATRGGTATAMVGFSGIQAGVGVGARTVQRPMDPNHHVSLGFDLFTRVSVFGLFVHGADHRVEHWFDLGGEAGVGGGGAHPAGFIGEDHAFIGAWADFGLWSTPAYPALVLGVRQMYDGAPWNDEVVYSIGLAFVHRSLDFNPNWRD
jgi:hypothetical protein